MNEILYLDLYFLTNFAMDLVSLGVASLVSSEKIRMLRLTLASLFGGVFSCLIAIFSPGAFWDLLFSIPALILILFIGFGSRGKRMGRIALFYLLTALFLGGAVEAISYYMGQKGSLTLGIFLFLVFLSFGFFQLFGRRMNQKLSTAVVSIAVRFAGRCEYYYGLVDSGLLLRDPEEGKPVLILKAGYATPLLSEEFLQRLKSGGEGSIAIPMKTASGSGVLYAFRPDGVKILRNGKKRKEKEEREILIALDFSEGGFGGCPCLVPLSVI